VIKLVFVSSLNMVGPPRGARKIKQMRYRAVKILHLLLHLLRSFVLNQLLHKIILKIRKLDDRFDASFLQVGLELDSFRRTAFGPLGSVLFEVGRGEDILVLEGQEVHVLADDVLH
jgi:hypothetical protein